MGLTTMHPGTEELRKLPRERREVLHMGKITVARWFDGKVWITNALGEGMQCEEAKLEQVVREFFEREF